MEPTTQDNTATAFRYVATCAKCGGEGASVEVIAPGGLPQEWDGWSEQDRESHLHCTDSSRWRLLYRGIVGGNGTNADPISEAGAVRLYGMLHPFDRLAVMDRFDDFLGWCPWCSHLYCARCYAGSGGGVLACPEGHGRAMDPYW